MITQLRGKILKSNVTNVVIDVGGVGYEVLVPLSTFDRLPPEGNDATILTYLHHTENKMSLYGFFTEAERELFKMLLTVSGIGPRVALGALSGSSVENLKAAISRGDVKLIKSIQGIGPKTAERIIVELKDKVGILPSYEELSRQLERSPEEKITADAVLALISLGYNQSTAHMAVKKVFEKHPGISEAEEIIKLSLKYL